MSTGITLDGTRVLKLRRSQAFTQKALAARAGITFRTLRNAEHGVSISLPTWRKIAEALLVEPSELLADGVEA